MLLTAPVTRAVVGPNWFASVMGTGMVALVLAPLVPAVATLFWALAATALVAISAATVRLGRLHLDHPVLVHFHGATAMALMTVGTGAVTLFDTTPAVALGAVLWTAGTAVGVATALFVPRRTVGAPLESVAAWWLMPVVPPTVSATTGALLVPHLPSGAARAAFVALCYALLVLSIVGTVRVLRRLAVRLRRLGPGAAATAPAWLIVLGPLGQSVTAVHHLGEHSGLGGLTPYYGFPVLAAALVWLVVAAGFVVRARPGFSLTWWSFTFPVGTLVTASGALGLAPLAAVLTVALLLGWVAAASGTLRGLADGSLLRG